MFNPGDCIRCKIKATSNMIFSDQSLKTRFIDGDMALFKLFDFTCVDINTDYIMTNLSQHSPLNQSYVADTKNCYFHAGAS
ncbi:hypothetical protein D3C85_1735130 [compost metagenome]